MARLRNLCSLAATALLLLTPLAAAQSANAAGDSDLTATISVPDKKEPAPEDERLVLEVFLNVTATGQVEEFIVRHGALYTAPDNLRQLRIRVPATVALTNDGLIGLDDLHVQWKLDRAKQVVYLTIADNLLETAAIDASEPDAKRVLLSSTGATLNYDMFGNYTSGLATGSGSFDARIFTPHGEFISDWLTYAGGSSTSGPTGTLSAYRAVRLDSYFTFADVNTLHRVTFGDFITTGLTWTRPVRFEGFQFRRDFTTRPDLITFPRPTIGGSAAVPSTVSVLINGGQAVNTQVDAGPFQVQQLPVVNGGGTITLNVVNAQGQQQTITQPFYASNTMLAPGLQTYAVQAGLVRRDWGLLSNEEGKVAGSAMYRRGLTNYLTVEASTEVTPGAENGGAGVQVLLGNYAVANAALAGSNATAGKAGLQYSAGVQRLSRSYSFGVNAVLANSAYRDIAGQNGTGIERKLIAAFAGVGNKLLGNVNAAYAVQNQDAPPVALAGLSTPTPIASNPTSTLPFQGIATAAKLLTASYNRSFHRVSFLATVLQTFSASGNTTQAQFGLTIPFGRRDNVTLGGASDGSGQLQVQQPAIIIGDLGYEAYVSVDGSKHEFGQVQYKARTGLYTAGMDVLNGTSTARFETLGALNIIDRGVFPSNYVYDSFAIVDTAPVQHVHVLFENRDVGTTDRSGKLLVADMNAFILNKLGVRATDIPVDATLATPSFVVRPQEHSGIIMRFHTEFIHAALVRLVDASGKVVAVGSLAELDATGQKVTVGFDGEAYVEHLAPRNKLTVQLPDGHFCQATFDYKSIRDDIPTIGPVVCLGDAP